MDLNAMMQLFKKHPEYHRMGMIATHLGIVRENSLTGRTVTGVDVRFDPSKIKKIIHDIESMDGIYKVLIEVREGTLQVGDEIMAVAIGGDVRERVFPALIQAVERIKSEAGAKREIFR